MHQISDMVTGIYIDNFELITFIDNTKPSGVSSAVTWVANEVVLVSDRFYNDAFNDVDVDLVLTNGSVTLYDSRLLGRQQRVAHSLCMPHRRYLDV